LREGPEQQGGERRIGEGEIGVGQVNLIEVLTQDVRPAHPIDVEVDLAAGGRCDGYPERAGDRQHPEHHPAR
jgi:hypothetical protein